MILSQMSHTIYMSNLTLILTQKMGLNFISTIVNNETAVHTIIFTNNVCFCFLLLKLVSFTAEWIVLQNYIFLLWTLAEQEQHCNRSGGRHLGLLG